MPAVISKAIKLGMIEIKIIRGDANKLNIKMAIKIMASTTLSNRLVIKNSFPFKNITQLPVSLTIHETGISMIYTAIILTTGFAMFGFSDFGGTAALGILLSLTLLIAYTSNLILLPAFLLSLEKSILKKEILNVPVFDVDIDTDEEDEK